MSEHPKIGILGLAVRTPLYMMERGVSLGTTTGATTGTFLFPIIGTIVGAAVGLGFGLVTFTILGIILAILMLIIGIEGIIRNHKGLRLFAGLAVSVAFFLLEVAVYGNALVINAMHTIILGLIFAIFALIPGVAATYSTNNWQLWLRKRSPRKLKLQPQHVIVVPSASTVFARMVDPLLRRIRWLMYIVPIGAIFFTVLHIGSLQNLILPVDVIGIYISILMSATVYILGQVILMAATVTPIIMLANYFMFSRRNSHQNYKRNLSILTFCLVLPSQLVVAAFIGAPIAAIIATLAVRDYADWVHSPEKQKAKPKAPSQVTTNDVLKEALKP